jgi:ADP-heptose:LPS heptosyltransferase
LCRRRRPRLLPVALRRIVVLRIDRIGDLVLSTPFLRNLRRCYPAAEIVLAARGFANALVGAELVDRIFALEAGHEAEKLSSLASESVDVAIDLHCDYVLAPALLLRKTGARCTVGFAIGGRGRLFDVPVPQPPEVHFIDETFEILRALGLRPAPCRPEVTIPASAYEEARRLRHGQGISDAYVTFHPGGFYPAQRWPAARFGALIDETARLGLAPLVLGGPGDQSIISDVLAHARTPAAVLCGEPVAVAAAAIAGSRLFVGNNSGPLHLACALGIPSVSTMGPTNPIRFWPVSDRACVLRARTLAAITVNEMFEAIRQTLTGS